MTTVRIAMWSGPRNISTAMMRAWGNRADTRVIDEPFYAAYLNTTGLPHPMAADVIASQPTSWDVVARRCATADDAPIVFQKHMTQHMIDDAPLDWLVDVRHAFLIRPPSDVAASFQEKWDGLDADSLGFRRQAELFEHVCQATGTVPPVVLASDVLENPEGMLTATCNALGVSFDRAMLTWPAGPRNTDGVWGRHWYNAVVETTGFSAPRPSKAPHASLDTIVESCMPHFEMMLSHRLKPA